ncbi:MAG TPA: heavy metal translocating P-type ATPase [Collinsella ihuae]|uniref:Heavy metal translocating P-type ATPase n=1 Tax=Collinsella ihumii TaxID=1720204 RepID=A0A921IRV0_9ACTN|nr:heavy metal translocating P-type ATPase [Collinsella ihumii]
MQITIEHEVPGRMRVKLAGRVPDADLDALRRVLLSAPAIAAVSIYPRIGSVAVRYADGEREGALAALRAVDAEAIDAARGSCEIALAPKTHGLLMDVATLVGGHVARRWFLPAPVRALCTLWGFRGFARAAARSLARARLDVPVLDAAAIGISLLQRDFKTAASTMLLLNLGELLEDYTRATSQNQLIYTLLDVPDYAQLVPCGDPALRGVEERRVPADSLVAGDLIVVRTGMPVPVDGTVEQGTAMVNQSSLTGEPLAVERTVGDDVFAGTAVEDGEAYVRVKAGASDTKLRSIVNLVEQAEAYKAEGLARRERLADRIVPWNFLLAGIVALTTRNLTRTSAALMVDYSCALKLTGAIAVLSAMSEAAREGFTVKGSRHFEAMAEADTIVFDKTGTLTEAAPRVCAVIPLDGWTRTQVLRFAACLEEHFPHPVARAVVRAAAAEGLEHRERHAAVEYLVAHGIASSLDGKRAVIGSEHFVVEDEGVRIPDEARGKIASELDGLSALYLAVDGELKGVVGIQDPCKPGTARAIRELRELGFTRIVMLTGDNARAASRIAAEAGIDEWRSDLLPEDKHGIVEQLRLEGRRVVMVGDGVNDSPALSAAHVGVAMGSGTAIAKEVADITLTEGDLDALVRLRRLSMGLAARMDASFAEVIGLNSLLLAGGVTGVVTPQASSLVHNGSTVLLSARNARAYGAEPSRRALPAAASR